MGSPRSLHSDSANFPLSFQHCQRFGHSFSGFSLQIMQLIFSWKSYRSSKTKIITLLYHIVIHNNTRTLIRSGFKLFSKKAPSNDTATFTKHLMCLILKTYHILQVFLCFLSLGSLFDDVTSCFHLVEKLVLPIMQHFQDSLQAQLLKKTCESIELERMRSATTTTIFSVLSFHLSGQTLLRLCWDKYHFFLLLRNLNMVSVKVFYRTIIYYMIHVCYMRNYIVFVGRHKK